MRSPPFRSRGKHPSRWALRESPFPNARGSGAPRPSASAVTYPTSRVVAARGLRPFTAFSLVVARLPVRLRHGMWLTTCHLSSTACHAIPALIWLLVGPLASALRTPYSSRGEVVVCADWLKQNIVRQLTLARRAHPRSHVYRFQLRRYSRHIPQQGSQTRARINSQSSLRAMSSGNNKAEGLRTAQRNRAKAVVLSASHI